jgi:type VI secretion system secreted protein Hcp
MPHRRLRFIASVLLVCCCTFALARPARAASNIFLQVDGVPGESTDDKHKAWIELLSFSTGVTQSGAVTSGKVGAGGGAAGKVDVAPFTVVKLVDSTSPKLFVSACNGKHIPKVVIEVATAGENKMVFLKYTLNDVIVSAIRTSAAGGSGDRPTEEVVFAYSKIEMEYTPQDAKSGKAGAPVKSSYDAATNKSVEGPSSGAGTGTAAASPAAPTDTGTASTATPAAPAAASTDPAAAPAPTRTLTRAQRERLRQAAEPQPAPAPAK